MADVVVKGVGLGGADVLSYMNRSGCEADEADLIKTEFQNRQKGVMIGFQELKSLLAEGGEAGVAKQLFDCMVKDVNGKISFDEFVDFIFSARSKTSQARFICQSPMKVRHAKQGFEPHFFPAPWAGLNGERNEDEDVDTPCCSFDQFYMWLSCTDICEGTQDVDFVKAQTLVGELKQKSVKGDRDGAMDFFSSHRKDIERGVRPDTGASYLASKETLRELRECALAMPGQATWVGKHTEGAECGELLQEALVAKLAAKGALRVTPRLIECLHQVVTCGRKMSCFREDKEAALPGIIQLGMRRHRPPPASALPTLVVLYCQQTETALMSWDAFQAAAFALWWVCNIQPFSDGNGRTARGLALAVLRLRGCSLQEKSFHAQLQEQSVRDRLAVCVGETNTATGSCACCQQGERVGVKPKAFEKLASLLKEIVQK